MVEQGDGWLVRDIMLKDVPLREKVTFEPENRVIFERTRGSELGRIENIIGEDTSGNLTLTFAFSLKKDGIPEGSDAEKAHFAPMESAYLNAVASTLAAVRRTVDEKGREHLAPKHPTDAAGDTKWIYDYYRAVDAMDMERTLAQHTDDTTLTFANHPDRARQGEGTRRRSAICGEVSKGLSHSMTGAWSMHDGQVGVAEAIVQYTRLDDSLCAIKFCTTLRRRGDKIADIRIYGDATPLFRSGEIAFASAQRNSEGGVRRMARSSVARKVVSVRLCRAQSRRRARTPQQQARCSALHGASRDRGAERMVSRSTAPINHSMAFGYIGDVQFEIIENISGKSTYSEFLDRVPEGGDPPPRLCGRRLRCRNQDLRRVVTSSYNAARSAIPSLGITRATTISAR